MFGIQSYMQSPNRDDLAPVLTASVLESNFNVRESLIGLGGHVFGNANVFDPRRGWVSSA